MKTIFVIGAGKGLGNSAARKFGANNFRVVLMSRNESSLKEYERSFKSEGIDVHTKRIDVSDPAETSRVLSEAVNEFGTPDVFLYNVGITLPDSKQEGGITPEVLSERYRSDVTGAYNCIMEIASEDFSRRNGTILITGGGLAMYPSAEYLPLSMDKAALRAMVQALHPVMKERGIFLGILTVCNVIAQGSSCAPEILAEKFWQQYTERKDWEIICE